MVSGAIRHKYHWHKYLGVFVIEGDVIIGSDVWIGEGAFILSGVTIGDGAVIGAPAVVSESVPPYAIVVGNPAREVRKLFNEHQIRELLRIKWWNWPVERIICQIDSLSSPDIDAFILLTDVLDQCFSADRVAAFE